MRSRLGIVLVYAVFATLWIGGTDRLLTEWVGDPKLQAWIGTGKGVAFVAITSLLLYLLLGRRAAPQKSTSQTLASPQLSRLIGLLITLSLVVPLLGYGIYHLYQPQVREKAFADLDAIAALKGNEIESWLSQRQDNATFLAHDAELARLAEILLRNPGDAETRDRIRARLEALLQVYAYEATLLDTSGRPMLAVAAHPVMSVSMQQSLLHLAIKTGQVQRSELYRDARGGIHLDYLVPLAGRPSPAVVLLHTPIDQFLFPLIQRWPTPSASGETMLVRREGDQVLYLNELRHQQHTALTLRAPLHGGNSPSALAVRAGRARHMETTDSRGIAVLAASRPVAGTAWFVVAKIDRAEVLAPLQRLTLWLSLLTLAAVAAISAALLLLWRQQQHSYQLALVAQSAQRDQLLRQFFDLPFVGMSITSPSSKRWIHVNDRLCDMLGYSRDEMLKLTWPELTYPEDLAADVAEFERVLRGDINTYQMDKRFVRKDGALVDTTIDVKAVRREDGSVEWFIATIQDVTEQKQAEKTQLTLRNRIDDMLESMIDGFIALDKAWRFIYINRYAAHLFGHEPQALIGKQIWEIFPEGQPFSHAYQRVMTQQTAEQVDNYFPPLQRWFENHIYPTPDGISIYFQDITDRKKMEASLRESEARFRAIIETEPECVKIIGPDGKLKFMNRAGLDMIGADSLDQVQNRPLIDIVSAEYREAFAEFNKRILQGERGMLEFEVVGLKGVRRFLETHAVCLPGTTDKRATVLGVTRDITERKHMETELRHRLAELTRWQDVMLGREDRVRALKQEINSLLLQMGQAERYASEAMS